MSKTIYSLPEYKFLDARVKKYFPKHELAIWWMRTSNSLQLVAAPKYSGYRLSEPMPYDKTSEIYSFSMGKFFRCDNRICDTHPNTYWLTQGFLLGSKTDLLLHMHNPAFKYDISLFNDLFKVAATTCYHGDIEDIRFIRHGIHKDIESTIITPDKPFALKAIPIDKYSFELFSITNDLILS